MIMAKSGDKVTVHYTGRLDDGTVVHTTRGRVPTEFTLGRGEVLPGLEAAVEGMALGEEKTVWVPADRAFGLHRDELIMTLSPDRFPSHIDLQTGQRLNMRRSGEPPVVVTVIEVAAWGVTLDANHPLAGEDLTFDLELVEIT